jgi:hypothetical protein
VPDADSLNPAEECLSRLIDELRHQLQDLVGSIGMSRDAVTHPDAKAESKYDTRALEASYLALGQSRRAAELAHNIERLESRQTKVRCLILRPTNGSSDIKIFLVDGIGAQRITLRTGEEVQVISEQSPLGQRLRESDPGEELVYLKSAHVVTAWF